MTQKFKADVPGNDKNYGVNIVNRNSQELKVFESVIDCMSYMDLFGDHTSNKLVLGMVEDNPLEQFLKDYKHIGKITFCLDFDHAGQSAIYGREDGREGLKEKYEDRGYEVAVSVPPIGKDFNESLIAAHELYQDRHPNYYARAYLVDNGNYVALLRTGNEVLFKVLNQEFLRIRSGSVETASATFDAVLSRILDRNVTPETFSSEIRLMDYDSVIEREKVAAFREREKEKLLETAEKLFPSKSESAPTRQRHRGR